ncbi:MAG: DUF1338 domain-containing protein [Planctomycetaceae bacterium]|nr:DUF1338 domain-containing protein [Planctomycetaceae bacterium]
MSSLDLLLGQVWQQYADANPQAQDIRGLLEGRGEVVVSDHIAFRTFGIEKVNINKVARRFVELGYESKASYVFEEKKLDAQHFEHPSGEYPLVFISELKVGEFSPFLQQTVRKLVEQLPQEIVDRPDFAASGVGWPKIAHDTYEKLRRESEYAAWVATFGYRANHFTVSAKDLQGFDGLAALNSFLKENGFQLNDSGGEVKGSPEVYLEQSSTMADLVNVEFTDCQKPVPCCFYEFAMRYPMPDGELFKGFVTQSANKLFESTNKKDN